MRQWQRQQQQQQQNWHARTAQTSPPCVCPPCAPPQVDVFSYGMILWSMWTRRLPFEGQDVSRLLLRVLQGRVVRPPLPGEHRAWLAFCCTNMQGAVLLQPRDWLALCVVHTHEGQCCCSPGRGTHTWPAPQATLLPARAVVHAPWNALLVTEHACHLQTHVRLHLRCSCRPVRLLRVGRPVPGRQRPP